MLVRNQDAIPLMSRQMGAIGPGLVLSEPAESAFSADTRIVLLEDTFSVETLLSLLLQHNWPEQAELDESILLCHKGAFQGVGNLVAHQHTF